MQEKPSTPSKSYKNKREPRKITRDYLKNAGIYYLGRYASTTSRFQDVMRRKIKKSIAHHGTPSPHEAEKWLDDVISDFVRLGYLNDAEFARVYSRGLEQKGLSQRSIALKLNERGVNIPDQMEIDDLSQALKFIKRKRMGIFSTRTEDHPKAVAKLARHGFSYSVCTRALLMSVDEIEDYLNNQDSI